MATISLLLGLVFLNDPSYFLYMKDGRVLEVKSMPHFEGKFCYFSLQDGQKSMLPSTMIDFDKTEKYNLELKKEKESIAAETPETVEKVSAKEAEAPKVVKFLDSDGLKNYGKTTKSNSGDVFEVVTQENQNILGPPKVQVWESEDDIYLAKETVSRTQAGFTIDCILAVNQPSGIKNAQLKLTVVLEDGSKLSMEKTAEPAQIPFNGQGTIQFIVETKYLIEATSYSISGELP